MVRLFLTTFLLIFVAELGDKTQIATLALASDSGRGAQMWIVFGGSALALIASSGLAVLLGNIVDRIVHPDVVRWISAGLFLAAAIWTIAKK